MQSCLQLHHCCFDIGTSSDVCVALCCLHAGLISGRVVAITTTQTALLVPVFSDLFTLSGLYMTAYTPPQLSVALSCTDQNDNPLGTATVSVSYNPIYVDTTVVGAFNGYTVSGQFSGCSKLYIQLATPNQQVVIDNVGLNLD